MPVRTPPTLLLAVTLVLVATAGCIGSGEVEDTGPEAPFASFDAALDADGPTFKPTGTAETTTRAADGQVTEADYSARHPFPVNRSDASKIVMDAVLDPGVTAELDVTLQDADGNAVGSGTLDDGNTEISIETSNVSNAGEWAVAVTGQGVQASYDVEITIDYPSTHPLTVKVLEPSNLDGASSGRQPFVFVLFDADADEPVTDADIALESFAVSMGHGTEDEEDPAHLAYGIYEGTINPSMPAKWEVRLDVTPPSGDAVEFGVPMDVES